MSTAPQVISISAEAEAYVLQEVEAQLSAGKLLLDSMFHGVACLGVVAHAGDMDQLHVVLVDAEAHRSARGFERLPTQFEAYWVRGERTGRYEIYVSSKTLRFRAL